MKRRRLAALSEHMETRLVLSPLLGLSGRLATNALRTGDAASLSAAETQTLSTSESDVSQDVSDTRAAPNTRTVSVDRAVADESAVEVNDRQSTPNVVDRSTTTESVTRTPADQSDPESPVVDSPPADRVVENDVPTREATLTTRTATEDQPRLTTNQAVEVAPSGRDATQAADDLQPVEIQNRTTTQNAVVEVVPANDVSTTPAVVTETTVDSSDVKSVTNEKETLRAKTDADAKTVRETTTDSSVSIASDETLTARTDVEPVTEVVPTNTISERVVELDRAPADTPAVEDTRPAEQIDNTSARTSTDDADRDIATNSRTIVTVEQEVDEIDPVSQVVPVFDEATGTVRLGFADEAPTISRRAVTDVETIDEPSGDQNSAETELKTAPTREPTVAELPTVREEPTVDSSSEATITEREDTAQSTATRTSPEVVDEIEEPATEAERSTTQVLRTAVGQPVPIVRADVVEARTPVEASVETIVVVADESEPSVVAVDSETDSDTTTADDVPATDDAGLSRETTTESPSEASPETEVQESDSETRATEESTEPVNSAVVVARTTKAAENNRQQVIRLSDEEPGRRVKVRERHTLSWTELQIAHRTQQMSTAEFDLFGIGTDLVMREHEAAEVAASQTVFGDATRLGIMLAAIKTAGRRSGSQILFSLTDDDARGEGGSNSADRRRRERTKARRWESFRHKRGRGELPFGDIDESAAIPCSNLSVDSVFADSASMCVLFEDPNDDGQFDARVPFAGLLLGTAGLAAHRATRGRGKKSPARPELPVPRYNGDTVVFAE